MRTLKEFPGGLEVGESLKWDLSLLYKPGADNIPDDAEAEVIVSYVNNADGERLHDIVELDSSFKPKLMEPTVHDAEIEWLEKEIASL